MRAAAWTRPARPRPATRCAAGACSRCTSTAPTTCSARSRPWTIRRSRSREDTFAFHEDFAWDDHARLVDAAGELVDAHSMGFSERDRLELVKCVATPERQLDGKRITDCFSEGFFHTNFWWMWCTTFAFEPWHSAIEFRRYLNRFVHLFKTFDTMSGIYRTRFNQFDSIVRPLLKWLTEQGVSSNWAPGSRT